VGGEEIPTAVLAHLPYRIEHNLATRSVQLVRGLAHAAEFALFALGIGGSKRRSGYIVVPVNRERVVAVQPRAVTGEGNEVSQRHGSLRSVVRTLGDDPCRSLTLAARLV